MKNIKTLNQKKKVKNGNAHQIIKDATTWKYTKKNRKMKMTGTSKKNVSVTRKMIKTAGVI